MSRRLDLTRVWQTIGQHGLDLPTVARRTGLALHHPDVVDDLEQLQGIPADQLVRLAEVLRVTVDELLTVDDTDPQAEPQDGFGRSLPSTDADTLHAALVTFGNLGEHALAAAFGWNPQRLAAAVTMLQTRLGGQGVALRRHGSRVMLQATPAALPPWAASTLTHLSDDSAVLAADHAPFLVTAIRAHTHGGLPGPPLVPRHVTETLHRQGAARPPARPPHTDTASGTADPPRRCAVRAGTDRPTAPRTRPAMTPVTPARRWQPTPGRQDTPDTPAAGSTAPRADISPTAPPGSQPDRPGSPARTLAYRGRATPCPPAPAPAAHPPPPRTRTPTTNATGAGAGAGT